MNQPLNQLTSLGRYKLIRELGRGGMSIVYLAQDTELGREVAIKCVDADNHSNARLVKRLRTEAKLLAQLNHPNIVQLYDVVEQENIIGLVIEFVGGETLSQRLKQAPSKEVVLKWLAEVADGLASAHKKGIAHCDLKADNVLITHDNIAKVADFGIAKIKLDDYLEDDGLTRIDSISGSYFSLSPEQATGQAVDTRTDLFSLAVLIYQSLVGEHPFGDTSNKVALLQRIINNQFDVDRAKAQILGVRLIELLSNLLNKNPAKRLYSAAESSQLLRHETSNPPKQENQDLTEEIPLIKITSNSDKTLLPNVRNILGKTALIASGFIIGLLILKFSPTRQAELEPETVSYIGLEEIEVNSSNNFDKTLLSLINNTLQQSAENALLNLQQTGLVDARELSSINGNYRQKARVAGVQDIVSVSANCLQQKCDIKLQRRSGERMAVTTQTSFPVASNSLIEIRDAITDQLPKLFNRSNILFTDTDSDLDEENYRRYLEIYSASKSGNSSNEVHFRKALELINDSPNFVPAYVIAYKLGTFLDQNVMDQKHLAILIETFDKAPTRVLNSKSFKKTIIQLHLTLGETEIAKSLFSSIKSEFNDQLYLSEIESSIAYAESDYERLLVLDKQNANWRPTAENLYNLATSEFFFGNYEEAKQQLRKALSIQESFPDALRLKASIEMSLGNLEEAILNYRDILKTTPGSNSFSNYGLALALNKNYQKSIENHLKAIELNPNSPLFHLNLADTYYLVGAKDQAKDHYLKVVSLVSEPETAQDYSYLAQAQAHLSRYNEAVKTLKLATKKFPNIAELDYASSIVNTLAGNYISAVVDVSDAIDRGIAPVWFSFEWFKPLCNQPSFKDLGVAETISLCQD